MKQLKTPKPCAKCPYKLGLVKFVINPCPKCKENNYQTYEQLAKIKSPLNGQ